MGRRRRSKLPLCVLVLVFVISFVMSSCSSLSTGQSVARVAECEALTDEWERENCYVNVSVIRGDAEYCDFITDRTRNYCLSAVGEATNNVVLCTNIFNDSMWGDVCFKRYAERTGEHRYCESVLSPDYEDDCYANIARDLEDAALCQQVINDEKIQKCIFAVAQESRNETLCRTLTHAVNEATCVEKIARLEGNESLCDTIRVSRIKQSCHDGFAAVTD